MKGQFATEMLTIVVIGLFIIIPLFYFSLFHSSQAASQIVATDAVNSIANTADYLYSLGNQSATTIIIKIPESIVSTAIINKTILLKLQTTAGVQDVFAITKANITGFLPNKTGDYQIKLQNLGNRINITG